MPTPPPLLLGDTESGFDDPIGDAGSGGGSGGTIPPNDLPGDTLIDPGNDLGDAEDGGLPGTTVITSETPGDLGTLYLDVNKYLLLMESRRENATLNGIVPINHRYRGHREAPKFNLFIQRVLALVSSLFLTLRSSNAALKTKELTSVYPTEGEIQNIYHVRKQIEFKEWQLLKSDTTRWFL